jgi:hypothetical protein
MTRKMKFERGMTGLVVPMFVTVLWLDMLPRGALAQRTGYVFTPIASLGDLAPGTAGGNFTFDFEPDGLNNRGDMLFGADVTTGGEGVFLRSGGQIRELARSGGNAPGGGVFDFAFWRPSSLNALGDAAFVFTLAPFGIPLGTNSGLYRYSHITNAVTSVVRPGVTPAPGGGTFAGAGWFGASLNNRGDIIFNGIISTDQGIHDPAVDFVGLGEGLFKVDGKGTISGSVATALNGAAVWRVGSR